MNDHPAIDEVKELIPEDMHERLDNILPEIVSMCERKGFVSGMAWAQDWARFLEEQLQFKYEFIIGDLKKQAEKIETTDPEKWKTAQRQIYDVSREYNTNIRAISQVKEFFAEKAEAFDPGCTMNVKIDMTGVFIRKPNSEMSWRGHKIPQINVQGSQPTVEQIALGLCGIFECEKEIMQEALTRVLFGENVDLDLTSIKEDNLQP